MADTLVRPAGADPQDRPLRLLINTATLVGLRVPIPLMSVALMLVLSRQLGADGVGRYTLVYGYLVLFNTVSALGLYPVISRDGARDRGALETMLGGAFTLGSVCSIALTLVMADLGFVFDHDAGTRAALLLLSLAILPCTLGFMIEAGCIALQRSDCYAAAAFSEYLFKVGFGVVLL